MEVFPSASIQEITRHLENSYTLYQILEEDGLQQAFQRCPPLARFLSSHIEELYDIALGSFCSDKSSYEKPCFLILTTQNQTFISSSIDDPKILLKLSLFLQDSSPREEVVNRYIRILEFLNKTTNFSVLIRLPNPAEFFKNLLNNIEFTSVFNYLEDICREKDTAVSKFLEDISATSLIFSSLSSQTLQEFKFVRLLYYSIYCADPSSSLFLPFSTNAGFLINLALSSKSCRISSIAFQILYELVYTSAYIDDEEKAENPIYQTIFVPLSKRLSDLCIYVQSSSIFLENKSRCVKLIAVILSGLTSIEESVFDLTEYLFKQMLSTPTNSFLQLAFESLFAKLSLKVDRCSKFLSKIGAYDKVISSIGEPSALRGTFIHIGDFLIKSDREVPAEFIYALNCVKEITDREYGGPLPSTDGDEDSEISF